MNPTANEFIDPAFLTALAGLAAADGHSWWRDILGHPDLVLAVRRNSINAYHRGASIFRIDWKGQKVVPVTHLKYLVHSTQSYVPLDECGTFKLPDSSPVIREYEGRKTLDSMIQTAKRYVGVEKAGLHPMLVGNSDVVDVEISLSRTGNGEEEVGLSEDSGTRKQDRIDAAVASTLADGSPLIRFYEAKHFSNPAIRSSGGLPAVIRQINEYEKALLRHQTALSARYLATAQALVALNQMRVRAHGPQANRQLSPIIESIAASGQPPAIDQNPHLLIYGFDAAQRDSEHWRPHSKMLDEHLPGRVLKIGSPTTNSKFVR